MKVIITTGHGSAAIANIWTLMRSLGIKESAPAHKDTENPGVFHEKLYLARKIEDPDEPGQIIPGRMWQNLAENLLVNNVESENWGWGEAKSSRLLDFWTGIDQSTYFVLLYVAPEIALAMSSESDGIKSDPLVSWRLKNAELLDFYSRNRDRCLLINTYSLISQPSQLAELLSERLGIAITATQQLDTASAQFPVSAIGSFLARNLLDDNEASTLYEELESASDLPASTDHYKDEAARAWQEHANLKRTEIEFKESITQLGASRKVAEQTQRELTHAREQIKQSEARKQSDEQEQSRLNARISELQGKLGNELQKNEKQLREVELLLLHSHQLQEELESSYLSIQEVESRLEAQSRELEGERAKSREYTAKITEGLKQIEEARRELAKALKHNEEQNRENDRLRVQFNHAQEELKAGYLKAQQIQEKLNASSRELESEQTRRTEQESKAREIQLELQNAWRELDKARCQVKDSGDYINTIELEQSRLRDQLQEGLYELDKARCQLNDSGDYIKTIELEQSGLRNQLQETLRDLDATRERAEEADDRRIASELMQTTLSEQIQQARLEIDAMRNSIAISDNFRQNSEHSQSVLLEKITQLEDEIDKEKKRSESRNRENSLLLLQLHHTQEELDAYFVKNQNLINTQKKQTEAVQTTQYKSVETAPFPPGKKSGFVNNYIERQKAARKLKRQISLIKQSGLFDENWYLKEYADVAKSGLDPIKHYLKFGAEEGRDPSLNFDTSYYQSSNPDIKMAQLNPLIHYISYGIAEGRRPHP